MMEGPGADSEEKHEPVSDIDTAVVVVGLKALDPEWPIREAIVGVKRKWPARARNVEGGLERRFAAMRRYVSHSSTTCREACRAGQLPS